MANLFHTALVDTADHHAMLRESVGKLVGKFGRRYFQDVVKRGEKPVELWNALAKAGFLGVFISEEYGGGGAGLADYNIIVEETAAEGCPILSLVIGSICAPIIEQHASDALKREWLPALASGGGALLSPSRSLMRAPTLTRSARPRVATGMVGRSEGRNTGRPLSMKWIPFWLLRAAKMWMRRGAARCRCSSFPPMRRAFSGPRSRPRCRSRRPNSRCFSRTSGDRVAVLTKNRAENFELIFACGQIGAILVGLNWRLSA